MRTTRQIMVGRVAVGGGAPVSIQSMTNTPTGDAAATLEQIHRLARLGCEIIRVALPSPAEIAAFTRICAESPLPVVADIHFDHRLAMAAVAAGAAGIRINPGNMKDEGKVRLVARTAAAAGCAVRIGVNGGSLEKELLAKYGHPTADAMVESALGHVRILEDLGFDRIKISLKASDIRRTVEAYRQLAARCDYPLHIGITEAGTTWSGTIKSAIGLGALLYDGIGDTLRVSLTGDPVEEVRVGWEILKSLELRERGPVFVSCPTCGRCQIDLISIAEEVEQRLHDLPKKITVAVMGCVVNGPGEAREADVGIAGGKGQGLLFRHGEIVRKVPEAELAEALIVEARRLAEEE